MKALTDEENAWIKDVENYLRERSSHYLLAKAKKRRMIIIVTDDVFDTKGGL